MGIALFSKVLGAVGDGRTTILDTLQNRVRRFAGTGFTGSPAPADELRLACKVGPAAATHTHVGSPLAVTAGVATATPEAKADVADDPADPPSRSSLAAATDRESRFLELVAAYGPRLRRIAGSYARGCDREDLHQEILCQIWRSLPTFRGDAALGTWVYRVALNTALTFARVRKRRPVEVPHADGEPDLGLTTAAAPGREEAILEEFLASLDDLDRSLLILYLDGLSHEEAAQVTGLRAGTVGVRLHRIKERYSKRYLEGHR